VSLYFACVRGVRWVLVASSVGFPWLPCRPRRPAGPGGRLVDERALISRGLAPAEGLQHLREPTNVLRTQGCGGHDVRDGPHSRARWRGRGCGLCDFAPCLANSGPTGVRLSCPCSFSRWPLRAANLTARRRSLGCTRAHDGFTLDSLAGSSQLTRRGARRDNCTGRRLLCSGEKRLGNS